MSAHTESNKTRAPQKPKTVHCCPHCRQTWLQVGQRCGCCRKVLTPRGAE